MSDGARQKRLVLIAAILGSAVVFVDGTVVNVALPAIRSGLHSELAGQQWIIDAYLLTLGSLLLIGGSLGDLLGRRRVFTVGVASFGMTSMLCAAAPTIEVLIAGRALQGVAGALLVPNTLGLIVATFDHGDRGKAIGSWTAWTGVATVIGPLAGGLILSAASWRWIFAINVVPIVITLVIARKISERHDRVTRGEIDVAGALMCALGLGGPVYALIEQQTYGYDDPRIFVPLIAGVAILCGFVAYEMRARNPMLPLDLFRDRNFSVGNGATLLIYGGLGAVLFLLMLFLQQIAGYSPLQAGASLLPSTALMFLLSKRFGSLSDRFGPRLFMSAGPIVTACGVLLMLRIDTQADYLTTVMPAVMVFGLGLSLTVAPLTAAVLGSVDERHAGIASAVNNAIARVAGLLAVAAIGAVLAAQFTSQVADQASRSTLTPAARSALDSARSQPLENTVPAGTPQHTEVVSALDDASLSSFRTSMLTVAALMAGGGLMCAVGIRNPRREVPAEECPGGQICGASSDLEGVPQTAGRLAEPALDIN